MHSYLLLIVRPLPSVQTRDHGHGATVSYHGEWASKVTNMLSPFPSEYLRKAAPCVHYFTLQIPKKRSSTMRVATTWMIIGFGGVLGSSQINW